MLLRTCTALDEHLQIEFLRGESLQRVLADCAEAILAHIAQKAIFEIRFAQIARIVVAKNAFHLSRWKNFPHNIEDRVVLKRLANLVELLEEPVEDVTLHCVGRDEIENQAVAG